VSNAVWSRLTTPPDGPAGFAVKTTGPDGVEVMLERWDAGASEPPHSHPGDDMTVVVEGRMVVQFYVRRDGALVPDGEPLVLRAGDTGYVAAGRIHDATYVEACKLVYVHDRAFGFRAES
jgi:quercetin dioxygenase-like cupin family protein